MRLINAFHLVWDILTKEILVDLETKNSRTVTEFTRVDLSGFDCATEQAKEAQKEKEQLKPKPGNNGLASVGVQNETDKI